MTEADFLAQVGDAIDRRRHEITHIKQVVVREHDSVYGLTVANMAVPMLYAHWEGLVRETLTLYVEFVESQELAPSLAHPAVFAFSIRKYLRRLTGNQTVDKVTEFARMTLSLLSSPVAFTDKTIDTRSNLKFDTFKELCAHLGIDVTPMRGKQRHVDQLVHRRNQIAHGGRPQNVTPETIEGLARLVVDLMEAFEAILQDCATTRSFCTGTKPVVSV